MVRRYTGVRSASAVTMVAASAAAVVAMLQAGPVLAATSPQANGGGQASLASISCTSASNCTAVGYMIPPGQNLAFVVSEKNGTWGKAERIPGLSALPGGSVRALVQVVSCSSVGNCAAGGLYVDHSGAGQAFVVNEKNGTWGNAEEVPGSAALNAGGTAAIEQLSCRSAGNCSAAGTYDSDESMDQQVFVVTEKNGTWGNAEEIPGTAALNSAGVAEIHALSCVTSGSCTVAGDYDGAHGTEPFVATQKNGVWGSARTFTAIAALNTGKIAGLDTLSCKSAGSCTSTGVYRTADGHTHVFAITETSGAWGAITPIPGMAALPKGGAVHASIDFLSCPSVGDCTAGGTYFDHANASMPYVVTEKNGVWGSARQLPGVTAVGVPTIGSLNGLACASAGNCTAEGGYIDNLKAFDGRVFVATEKNGTWGKAQPLPGSVSLSKGKSVNPGALACGAPGNCAVGGSYGTGASFEAPFLATQKNGSWDKAVRVPGTRG